MRKKLENLINKLINEKYNLDNTIKLDIPELIEHGDFTMPCFLLSKALKKAPPLIANEIKTLLENEKSELISEINAVGPYLNFKVNKAIFFESVCDEIFDESYGTLAIGKDKSVMVEFSSPNTNKPQHLGHIRNNVLGDAVSKIISACGYKVIKANLLNDRGIHICKAMYAWQTYGNGETPENSGIKGDHLIGKYYVIFENKLKEEQDTFIKEKNIDLATMTDREKDKFIEDEFYPNSQHLQAAREMLVKWENNDTETLALWNKLNSWVFAGFEETYKALDINFDKKYYESNTYKLGKEHVLAGLETGVCYQKEDGSTWIKLPEKKFGNDKILLRKDGTSVYMTQDIGTAFLKYEDYQMDKSVYVVGSEQEYHFQVLFKALELLGFKTYEGCYHLSYGMIYLPEGRMKSREGKVVDADDLIKEMVDKAKEEIIKRERPFKAEELEEIATIVGLGALKYYVLQYNAKTDFVFDPNASIDFNGKTGPYIQYTHARISSLLRLLNEVTLEKVDFSTFNSQEDFNLLRLLEQYPYIIEKAGTNYNTSFITEYLYNLAASFNSFYSKADNKIKEMSLEEQNLEWLLLELAKKVLQHGLSLLGIQAPEKM